MDSTTQHSRSHTAIGFISHSDSSDVRKANILYSLHLLGADQYDLHLPETFYLPRLIKPEEKLLGVVYGRYKHGTYMTTGRGLLVATNQRILLIDRKPFYLHYDEIMYDVVSGVTHGRVGLISVVTVNTRMGPISIRTFNGRCSSIFMQAVEQHLFQEGIGKRRDNDY